MASTRNKNMPGEYCLRQMSNMHSTNFMTYHGAALNKTNLLPCAGVLHGKVPNTVLSKNSTDVESFLLGINSSNLVDPTPQFNAKLKCHGLLSFYPRLQPSLPPPLVIEGCQRPVIFRR